MWSAVSGYREGTKEARVERKNVDCLTKYI